MYFLACAYNVVLITDQFWIEWFFGKNVIFWPKNAFLNLKWLFYPLPRSAPQSCLRTFCWVAKFIPFCEEIKIRQFPEESVRPIFVFLPLLFWPYFINFCHQTGFRLYILVYNSNIHLLFDTTLLNFFFQFGLFLA